jgi:hypothetical protein
VIEVHVTAKRMVATAALHYWVLCISAHSCRWKKGGPAIRGRSPACQSSRSDGENNNLDPTDSSAAFAVVELSDMCAQYLALATPAELVWVTSLR